MRKTRLELDSLVVESFDTAPVGVVRGTVHGQQFQVAIGGVVPGQYDTYPNCPSPLCVDTPLASCDGSCAPSCGASCNGTCASCGCPEPTAAETCPRTCGLCKPDDDWAVLKV